MEDLNESLRDYLARTDGNNKPLTSELSGSPNPARNTYGHYYAAPLTLRAQA
jgi:hypothetical protein